MKIGLDSNRDEFSKSIIKSLKEDNLFLIDMKIEKYKNEGYELHKKVNIANATRLDLFISIYLDDKELKENEIIIFYDESNLGAKIGDEIYENLRKKFGNKNISLRAGYDFYILKNIKAPSVMIRGNISLDCIEIEESLGVVVKTIFKDKINQT